MQFSYSRTGECGHRAACRCVVPADPKDGFPRSGECSIILGDPGSAIDVRFATVNAVRPKPSERKRSRTVVDVIRYLLYYVVFLFFIILIGRLVIDWIQVFARDCARGAWCW